MIAPAENQVPDPQQRIVRVLAAIQIFGGVGAAAGGAVGALLAADLGSESLSGLAAAATVIGAALIALPVSRVMHEHGRRPGLILAYVIGVIGAALVVIGSAANLFLLALLGLVAAGGGTTAGLQSRYAATDMATAARRGRSLSTVVWATTIGSVVGPNLAGPMGDFADIVGVPRLAGPYLLTIAVWIICALMIATLLRPDPLLAARDALARERGQEPGGRPAARASIRQVVEMVLSIPAATLGLAAMAVGHAVMVAVMSMTPVHLHNGAASLQIIGFVISGHITGMYVASPLVGMASDRFGRRPVIIGGGVILLVSFLIAGTATGHESTQLGVGLFLLGLGWSCTLIAGSTLLTESAPVDSRPNVQGTADLIMGIAGASAGLLSGVVVGFGSYAMLNIITTMLVIPLIVIAVRSARQHAATALT
ncbi:MAG: MFS transporter [Thermomicrobiales bacterium]